MLQFILSLLSFILESFKQSDLQEKLNQAISERDIAIEKAHKANTLLWVVICIAFITVIGIYILVKN